MNSQEQAPRPYEGRHIYRNPQQDKFYLGSYLQLARHNAYLILNYLAQEHGLKAQGDIPEERLPESSFFNFPQKLSGNAKALQSLMRDLMEHFPFLAILAADPQRAPEEIREGAPWKEVSGEPLPELAARHLQAALRRLDSERNFYAHYYYEPQAVRLEEQVALEQVFEAARKGVLRRFSWLNEEHLQRLYPQPGKEAEFMYRMHKPDGSFEDKGLYFFICLFLEPGDANRFLMRLYGFKHTSEPDKQATRKCFTHFCCKLPMPRLESSDVKLDMLNELYRCPKELYALLPPADRERFMVEEALPEDAAPDEVPRKVERKRHEDRFPYFALRYFEKALKDGEPFFKSLFFQLRLGRLRTTENPGTMGNRSEPRTWIKELNVFGRLSDFGHDKLDGRWLNADGELLPEIEQFSPHYQITGNRIALRFVNDYDPKKGWHLVRNLLNKVKSKEKHQVVEVNQKPDAILSTHELQNFFLYQHLHHEGLIAMSAEAFIQDYIQRLHTFYKDAKSGKVQPVREATFRKRQDSYLERTQAWLDERKALLQSRLNDYGLKTGDLPDALREFLLGYHDPDYIAEARSKLKEKIEEVKQLLKATKQKHSDLKANPNVAKKDRPLKAGDLADHLADDLNFLQPPSADGKGRADEDQFQRLQGHLAFFLRDRDRELKDIFLELQLEGDGAAPFHPFFHLTNWRNCTGVLHFYQNYYEQKIEWLKQVKNQIAPKDPKFRVRGQVYLSAEDFEQQYDYFLQISKKRPAIKNYDELPVMLPRGLFNAAIAKALAAKGYALSDRDSMTRYLSILLDCDTQKCYSELPRPYLSGENGAFTTEGMDTEGQIMHLKEAFENARAMLPAFRKKLMKQHIYNFKGDKRSGKYQEIKDWVDQAIKEKDWEISDAHQRHDRAMDTEKRLRQVQSNDRALFLMIQDLAKLEEASVQKEFENWALSGIRFPNEPASMDGAPSNDILDREITMHIHLEGKTVVDRLKIKRYGEFRKFMKDRRLPNLLKYFEETEIQRTTLVKELEEYSRGREALLEKIFSFEKKVLDLFSEEMMRYHQSITLEANQHYISHSTFLQFMEKKGFRSVLTSPSLKQVRYLRNKFEHNEIPHDTDESLKNETPWISGMVASGDPGTLITARLINIVGDVYDKFIQQLEQEYGTTINTAAALA